MATSYTNLFKDNFLEPFRELMRGEFNKIELFMDKGFKDRGSSWFNLNVLPESTVSMRSSGQHREYEVELWFYRHTKLYRGRKWWNEITEMGEWVKRFVGDNSNFTVRTTWVEEDGTWGATTRTWSTDTDTHCWFNMHCEVEYDPDVEDEVKLDMQVIKFTLTFDIEEVYD